MRIGRRPRAATSGQLNGARRARRQHGSGVGALLGLAAVGLATFGLGCSDLGDPATVPDPDPEPNPSGELELDSIVPARTYVGAPVVLAGVDFGETVGRVVFTAASGTVDATVVTWTDMEIEAFVPEGAVEGPVVITVGGATSEPVSFTPAPEVSLRDDVRPIFRVQGCQSCHGGSGGLFLDTHASILSGGGRGPAVTPGDSAGSLMIHSLRGDGVPLMPQGAPESIPEAQILVIADWIDQGARDN